tara:strand:+ start:477 stop:1067 length:591 start_codon:yes stop_codon:yes gene_type:complete
MTKIQSIGVYCGASNHCPEVFNEAARDFGILMAKNKVEIVYGGGRVGLMGITAKACIDNGGKVCGVIPRFLDNHEGGFSEITELHYVDSMHERKQLMFERSDAFAVLPGGFGTLDELCEILTWKQVGLHKKYIFILDINRYWSPIFCEAMEIMVKNKFVRKEDKNLFTLIERVEDMIPFLSAERPKNQETYVNKWG